MPLIGDTSEISSPVLITAIALLIVIWAVLIFLYIKLKKKKQLQKLPELPGVQAPSQVEKKGTLSEEELKQLFKEIAPSLETAKIPMQIPQKPTLEIKKPEQNLNELKNLILNLLNKNYTRESIIKHLQKKGWKFNQMAQVIKNINENNLRNYIKEASSLGYARQQYTPLLLSKGWSLEDIDKTLKTI